MALSSQFKVASSPLWCWNMRQSARCIGAFWFRDVIQAARCSHLATVFWCLSGVEDFTTLQTL